MTGGALMLFFPGPRVFDQKREATIDRRTDADRLMAGLLPKCHARKCGHNDSNHPAHFGDSPSAAIAKGSERILSRQGNSIAEGGAVARGGAQRHLDAVGALLD